MGREKKHIGAGKAREKKGWGKILSSKEATEG